MPRYDAYLLRIWRGGPGDSHSWASRLEHLPDGQYQRFGSLEELLAHLRSTVGRDQPTLSGLARVDTRSEIDEEGGTRSTTSTFDP